MICPVCNGTGAIEPRREHDPEIKTKIQHLLGHGISYTQIGATLSIHKSTVGYYVKRYGLKRTGEHVFNNLATIDNLAESGRI